MRIVIDKKGNLSFKPYMKDNVLHFYKITNPGKAKVNENWDYEVIEEKELHNIKGIKAKLVYVRITRPYYTGFKFISATEDGTAKFRLNYGAGEKVIKCSPIASSSIVKNGETKVKLFYKPIKDTFKASPRIKQKEYFIYK